MQKPNRTDTPWAKTVRKPAAQPVDFDAAVNAVKKAMENFSPDGEKASPVVILARNAQRNSAHEAEALHREHVPGYINAANQFVDSVARRFVLENTTGFTSSGSDTPGKLISRAYAEALWDEYGYALHSLRDDIADAAVSLYPDQDRAYLDAIDAKFKELTQQKRDPNRKPDALDQKLAELPEEDKLYTAWAQNPNAVDDRLAEWTAALTAAMHKALEPYASKLPPAPQRGAAAKG